MHFYVKSIKACKLSFVRPSYRSRKVPLLNEPALLYSDQSIFPGLTGLLSFWITPLFRKLWRLSWYNSQLVVYSRKDSKSQQEVWEWSKSWWNFQSPNKSCVFLNLTFFIVRVGSGVWHSSLTSWFIKYNLGDKGQLCRLYHKI